MSFKPLVRIRPLRWALYRLALRRVQEKLLAIGPYLNPADRVANLSFVDGIVPIVYDGTKFPFDNDSFDVAMVITVLHHAQDPDAVLAELRRVARRVIIIEEIYENSFEKYFTYLIDSLFNLEFFSHPRSNRTDDGWRATFQKLGLAINKVRYSHSLGFLRRVTYHLVRS